MNRRQFFGMSAAALAAIGLSEMLPAKTIFLPPRFGWGPTRLLPGCIREAGQYDINNDEMIWRYDVIGVGSASEHKVTSVPLGASTINYRMTPEQARASLQGYLERYNLVAIPPMSGEFFHLPLPSGIYHARYI